MAGGGKEGKSGPAVQQRSYDVTEHKLSLAELAKLLESDISEESPASSNGLSSEEAKRRLARDGPNALRPPKATPEIIKYLKLYLDPFMVLLNLAGILSYILYAIDTNIISNLACGIALSIIVFVQCTMGYLEGRKTSNVLASLKKMVPSMCRVIRDGQPRRVDAADLVVGDVVQLKGGDRVPADMRIIQTSGLKVECSSLTGEPDAVEVTLNATHDESHESKNLVFNTSQCTEGSAFGVVVRTGDKTLIGMVAALASDTSVVSTTLEREVQRAVYFITGLAGAMALAILIIGLANKQKPVVVVNLVVAIFVANVPQGLPATVTACLSIAAKRLSQRNVMVKNLQVIETLGAASCIASDKTGTLTQNKMSVQNFWFNGSFEMLNGAVMVGVAGAQAYGTMERTRRPSSHSGASGISDGSAGLLFSRWGANPLEPLLLIAAVCNSARYAADAEDANASPVKTRQRVKDGALVETAKRDMLGVLETTRQLQEGSKRITVAQPAKQDIVGDASEAALMRYCDSIYPVEQIRAKYPRVFDQPFNSTVKYALCVAEPPAEECPGKQYVFLKGAPEVVLERCSTWLCGGVAKPVDEGFRHQFQAAYERFAKAGERVLGFASQTVDKRPVEEITAETVPSNGFVFMGLVSLMDPPKDGVDQAVLDCHQAGIRVFMVTGDHALTAEAIARKVNIITLPTRADIAGERGVPLENVDPRDPAIQAVVVTGSELKSYTEETWGWLLPHKQIVFARTTPTQKLEIVEHLQARGEIVAVTGDGVNDSPALKKADIGVAMGNPNASDVAREAADIIILDDNFCSIVNAIREGRLLFDNLKKSIVYTISHLPPMVLSVALSILLGFPLGLSSMLILSIDLGSELVPAISLAYEEPESAIMQRPPRDTKRDRLVSKQVLFYCYCIAGTLEGLVCMLAYFCIFWAEGINLTDLMHTGTTYWMYGSPVFLSRFSDVDQVKIFSRCNAAWYANLVLCQMFHLWFTRTRVTSVMQHPLFSNRVVCCAMVWEISFILVFCFVPDFQPIFASGLGLPIHFWLLSLGFFVGIGGYTEFVKFFVRRLFTQGRKSSIAKLAW